MRSSDENSVCLFVGLSVKRVICDNMEERSVQISGVKTVLFSKTGNRFVETGNVPVIGLREAMCHVAAYLERKPGQADKVKCGYVITMSTVCVN